MRFIKFLLLVNFCCSCWLLVSTGSRMTAHRMQATTSRRHNKIEKQTEMVPVFRTLQEFAEAMKHEKAFNTKLMLLPPMKAIKLGTTAKGKAAGTGTGTGVGVGRIAGENLARNAVNVGFHEQEMNDLSDLHDANAGADVVNDGRTFKHLLLYRLLQQGDSKTGSDTGGGGGTGGRPHGAGYGGGWGYGYGYPPPPYWPSYPGAGGGGGGGFGQDGGIILPIFINNPTNLTNVNNNTISNVGDGADDGGGGAAAGDAGLRINYFGLPASPPMSYHAPQQMYYHDPHQMSLPPTQALPYPIRVKPPTEVYQQRQDAEQLPHVLNYVLPPGVSFMQPHNNGGGGVIPLAAMPQVYGYQNSAVKSKRKGNQRYKHHNYSNNKNPFATFANNLRGIQFL